MAYQNNNRRNYGNNQGNSYKNSSRSTNVESKHKSGAKWVTVEVKKFLGNGTFKKVFAWKYTRKDGLISLQAYKNKEQTTKDGSDIKAGYEKWYVKLKTRIGEQTISAIYNTSKGLLFFEMGTTKCVVSPSQNYWAYLMPKNLKNRR